MPTPTVSQPTSQQLPTASPVSATQFSLDADWKTQLQEEEEKGWLYEIDVFVSLCVFERFGGKSYEDRKKGSQLTQ